MWEALRKLAYGDGERTAVVSAIAHAQHLVDHDERLERVKAQNAQAEQNLAGLQKRRREAEATVEDAKERKLRTEARLASGRLQGEREIEAAQHEIASLARAIADGENLWLETSDGEETAQATLKVSRAALRAEEVAAQARHAKALEDARDAESRLAAIDAARRDAAKVLPAAIRDRYRRLYPSTGGHPFATAVAGECSHCHRPVPGDAMQMLRLGTGVPSCPSCSRLLLPPS